MTKITKSLLSNTGRLKSKDKAQKKEKVVHLLSTAHTNRPTVDNSGKLDKDGNAVKSLVAFCSTITQWAA